MKKLWRYFHSFYQKHGWLVILYVFLTVLHKGLAFLTPQALQRFIDAAVKQDLKTFTAFFWLNLALTLAFVAALTFRSYIQELGETHAAAMSSERVLRDMLFLPFQKLRQKSVGHYIHLMERDVDRVKGLAFYDLTVFASNVVLTAGMLVYMLQMDGGLSLIVVLTIPLLVLITKIMLPKVEKAEEAALNEAEHVNDMVDDCYTGGETIRASNAESFFAGRAHKAVMRLAALQKKRAKANVLYDALLITGLMNIANILIYCVGGFRVVNGFLTIGVVNTFALYFSSLWNCVEGFMEFVKEYKVKQISLERLSALHRLSLGDEEGCLEKLAPFQRLEVRDLCYAYDEKTVLNHVSFNVQRGERLLITGENGSGKSTLARLLCKLLSPSSGAILYNGCDYRKIDAAVLRSRIQLVPAEAFLVEGDWKDNLLGAAQTIKPPSSLQNISIAKGGGNLSGGQRKQMQLFRCMVSEADVILLDEPFNFLDNEAKQRLWNEILHVFERKTLIIISHDPYPQKDCTRVLPLQGKQNGPKHL